MSYTVILEQFHLFSWNIYFGGMLLFAIYSIFNTHKSQAISLQFQGFGVIFGLSLGAAILSKIVLHWLDVGHYYPRNTAETLGFGFAFLTWLSNMVLEVWTLDPIRKFHKELQEKSFDSRAAEMHFFRHLWLHTLFLVGVQLSFGFI